MTYRVVIAKSASKQLAKLSGSTARRVGTAIESLADDPRPAGCKKLVGQDRWRIRVGDYRIIYTIKDDVITVTVTVVAHRREVYNH